VTRNQACALRFHDLRHSYATRLVDDGVPVNTVQRVLGHERSSTILDLYTRRTDDPSRVLRALDADPAPRAFWYLGDRRGAFLVPFRLQVAGETDPPGTTKSP
jgi:Phage integrase family